MIPEILLLTSTVWSGYEWHGVSIPWISILTQRWNDEGQGGGRATRPQRLFGKTAPPRRVPTCRGPTSGPTCQTRQRRWNRVGEATEESGTTLARQGSRWLDFCGGLSFLLGWRQGARGYSPYSQECPTYFVKEQVYIRYVHLCSLCWAKIYCL